MSGLRNLRLVLFVVSVATIHWLLICPIQATAQSLRLDADVISVRA
jgi:hypothetical protein